MEGLQRKFEHWIKDQTSKFPKLQIPQLPQLRWVRVKWPPWSTDREHQRKLQEEFERRRKQLNDLCLAIKAESVSDLQDILCCMVLSECVYKVVIILCTYFLLSHRLCYLRINFPKTIKDSVN